MTPQIRLKHILLNTFILILLVAFTSEAAVMPLFSHVPDIGTLSTSTVNALSRDDDGYLWIGTDKELIVFDGNNSVNTSIYSDNDKPLGILSLGTAADSVMLVGTSAGVYRFDFSADRKPAKVFPHYSGSVGVIESAPGGMILIGDNKSLMVADSYMGDLVDTEIKGMSVRSVVPMEKIAYIGTEGGVYEYEYGTGTANRILGDSIEVTAMIRDRDHLYIATHRDGLRVMNITTGNLTSIIGGGILITDLAKDTSGNIFIATDGDGILKYDNGSKTVMPFVHSHGKENKLLHNNQVYALEIDDADRMYVGFYMGGAEYASPVEPLLSYYPMDEKEDFSVRALYTGDRHLLVGTRDGAYYIDKSTGSKSKISREKLGSRLVLTVDKIGDVYYLGTFGGGLSIYDPSAGTLSRVADTPRLTTGDVFSISYDKAKDITWIATSSGLYALSDNKVVKHIDATSTGQPLGIVYEVYTDSKGTVWACTREAVYRLESGSDKLVENTKIKAEDVRQMLETRSHFYWMVTNAGTVEVYDADYNESPLTSKLKSISGIKGVAEDGEGNVWITSDCGLFRYSPRDKFLTQYLNIHGLVSPVFNSGKPMVDADGIMYFCHSKGLLQADTRKASDSGTSRLRAVPTAVSDSHGKRLLFRNIKDKDGVYNVELLSTQKLIKLYISDFSYTGSDLSRYEYSTDAGDTWTKMQPSMAVTFTNLDGENLDLLIRQIGNPLTETKVHIENKVSLWDKLQWWVILALILAIACSAVFMTRFIKNKDLRFRYQVPGDRVDKGTAAGSGESVAEEETAGGSKNNALDVKPKYEPSKKYAAHIMSEAECEEIAGNLGKWLESTKSYTNPNLKISDVAVGIGVPSHRLSYVLSQHLSTNYYDYLYRYRVDEFKRLAAADTKHAFTLIALSEQAGFNSKATFFRAFKKREGITPGDYLKGLRVSKN